MTTGTYGCVGWRTSRAGAWRQAILIAGVLALAVLLVGCVSNTDPVTGKTTYSMAPWAVSAADAGAALSDSPIDDAAAGWLAAINPALGSVALLAVGGLAWARKKWTKYRGLFVQTGTLTEKLIDGGVAVAQVVNETLKPGGTERARFMELMTRMNIEPEKVQALMAGYDAMWGRVKADLKAAADRGAINADKAGSVVVPKA